MSRGSPQLPLSMAEQGWTLEDGEWMDGHASPQSPKSRGCEPEAGLENPVREGQSTPRWSVGAPQLLQPPSPPVAATSHLAQVRASGLQDLLLLVIQELSQGLQLGHTVFHGSSLPRKPGCSQVAHQPCKRVSAVGTGVLEEFHSIPHSSSSELGIAPAQHPTATPGRGWNTRTPPTLTSWYHHPHSCSHHQPRGLSWPHSQGAVGRQLLSPSSHRGVVKWWSGVAKHRFTHLGWLTASCPAPWLPA